jgi:hypothetical protein
MAERWAPITEVVSIMPRRGPPQATLASRTLHTKVFGTLLTHTGPQPRVPVLLIPLTQLQSIESFRQNASKRYLGWESGLIPSHIIVVEPNILVQWRKIARPAGCGDCRRGCRQTTGNRLQAVLADFTSKVKDALAGPPQIAHSNVLHTTSSSLMHLSTSARYRTIHVQRKTRVLVLTCAYSYDLPHLTLDRGRFSGARILVF